MVSMETMEKSKIKITFSVSPARFEEGLKYSYNKNKSQMNVSGFRKGKVPRQMLEMQYGKEIFYEDAINFVLPDAYDAAIDELQLDTVSRPEIDLVSASKEEGVVFTAEVYVKPQVEIGNYVGIEYNKVDYTVTDEDINKRIDIDRNKNSRLISVADRPAQNGDTVTIDFKGYTDGVPFEGGEASGYEIVLGSKSFVDTFEEQIAGHMVGDNFNVNVTFPENYTSEALSGKPAMFEVKLLDIRIKELPDADDDFAQDVSEFDTFEEYRNDIAAKLTESKKNNAAREKENRILNVLVEQTEIDIPEAMIDTRINEMINDMASQMKGQGISLDMYLNYMGQTIDSLRENYKPSAVEHVKSRLILEEIAKRENFDITEDDIDDEINNMAEMYGMDKEKMKQVLMKNERNTLKLDIGVKKALDYVIENAVELDNPQNI